MLHAAEKIQDDWPKENSECGIELKHEKKTEHVMHI